MKKKYKAIVNDQFDFHLTSDDAIPFEMPDSKRLHATNEHQSVNAEFRSTDFHQRKYTVRINAALYEVEIKTELDILIDQLGLSADVSSVFNELKAPMPGLIVDVLTEAGAKVKAGDGLIVLEAMKMENKLTASHDGIVKSVHVKKSDAVEKGSVLIEFEKDEKNK